MKVDFSVCNNKNRIHNHFLYMSKPSVSAQHSQISELSGCYYVPFKGIEKPALNKSLEILKNIHCPSCGVKMLTQKGFQEFLLNAENITTKEGLLRFLNVNFEYIDESIQGLIKILNKIEKEKPNIELTELLLMAQKCIDKNFENIIARQITKLSNFQESSFSKKDRQLLANCAESIRKIHYGSEKGIRNSAHKDILKNTFSEMENPDKWDMYQKFRREFTKIYEKKVMLSYSLSNNRDIPQVIIENIFKRSISRVNKFNDNIDQESSYNTILLCDNCTKHKSNVVSDMINNPDEAHFLRYNRYLNDIAQKILAGETDLQPSYLICFNNRMKYLSKGSLIIKGTPIMSKLKQQHFIKRIEGIEFNLTEKEGIPCAGCGKTTITHSKRVELFDKIKNAENKQEIVQILKENPSIIHATYEPIVEEFINIVNKNPNIKDLELVNHLKRFSSERIKLRIENNINYIKKVIKYAQVSVHDKNLLTEFLNELNEKFLILPADKPFPWYDYSNLLKRTVGKMENRKMMKYYNHLKYSVKKIFSSEYITYPIDTISNKFDSPLKVVIQNIIKESVATKDHITAKAKAGSDDKENLIVLCKCCNRLKGSTGFFNWQKHNNEVGKSLANYFRVINEKIKTGEIESEYKEYLKELQMNIYSISKGNFDVDYLHDL